MCDTDGVFGVRGLSRHSDFELKVLGVTNERGTLSPYLYLHTQTFCC